MGVSGGVIAATEIRLMIDRAVRERIATTKQCARCHREFPFDEFYVNRGGWLKSRCKTCSVLEAAESKARRHGR